MKLDGARQGGRYGAMQDKKRRELMENDRAERGGTGQDAMEWYGKGWDWMEWDGADWDKIGQARRHVIKSTGLVARRWNLT